MLRALYTAASGMIAQQFNIDTIAHNLANVNTTAFKKVRPEFQDLLYLTIRRPVAPQGEGGVYPPVGLEVGLGVRAAGSQMIFQQGNLRQTNNPLDLAITGPGFFVVKGPDDAEYYTRDGGFKLDAERRLVTSEGYLVLDENGSEIELSEAIEITVAQDGTISYTTADNPEPQEAGKLQIVQFPNPAGLEKVGHNLYRATYASGEAEKVEEVGSRIRVEQGFLEESNVQVVEEIVSLITAQRAYELNSKAIQAADEMLSIANNIRR